MKNDCHLYMLTVINNNNIFFFVNNLIKNIRTIAKPIFENKRLIKYITRSTEEAVENLDCENAED